MGSFVRARFAKIEARPTIFFYVDVCLSCRLAGCRVWVCRLAARVRAARVTRLTFRNGSLSLRRESTVYSYHFIYVLAESTSFA